MGSESWFKKGGWDARKETAARMIFEGKKTKDVALALGVSERQIYRWKNEEEFSLFQNEYLTHSRGEYLLRAKQAVRAAIKQDKPSRRDPLDWLKFISAETEKIDYSDPVFGIPPERLGLHMTKATRKSLDRKIKAGKKK
jgi:hypothetical protein